MIFVGYAAFRIANLNKKGDDNDTPPLEARTCTFGIGTVTLLLAWRDAFVDVYGHYVILSLGTKKFKTEIVKKNVIFPMAHFVLIRTAFLEDWAV